MGVNFVLQARMPCGHPAVIKKENKLDGLDRLDGLKYPCICFAASVSENPVSAQHAVVGSWITSHYTQLVPSLGRGERGCMR